MLCECVKIVFTSQSSFSSSQLDDDEDLDAKFADEDSDDDEAYRRRLRKTFDTEERQAGEHGDRVQVCYGHGASASDNMKEMLVALNA